MKTVDMNVKELNAYWDMLDETDLNGFSLKKTKQLTRAALKTADTAPVRKNTYRVEANRLARVFRDSLGSMAEIKIKIRPPSGTNLEILQLSDKITLREWVRFMTEAGYRWQKGCARKLIGGSSKCSGGYYVQSKKTISMDMTFGVYYEPVSECNGKPQITVTWLDC